MCGIAGIAVRNGIVAPELLQRTVNSLAHRGPDDSGTIILHDAAPEPVAIGLGSRRLAILDLSPLGHQPMKDPETGNWFVYNGEIYNFREVREKLEREGARFRSRTDTEVVLQAYGRWGERCLREFRGMFAFAIWDARQHQLFLVRDPMGIKPLYYYSSENTFLFASELRTLLGTGLVPRRLDRAGLINYLTFGSSCDPITAIEGVSALRPGHWLVWKNGRVREEMYWDLAGEAEHPTEAPSQTSNGERKKLEEEVYSLLDQAVRMQTVSDVPVGVFLSGGIDSSSVAGILSRSGPQISTFAITFAEAEYNEAEYSRAVAAKFNTDHHEVLISQRDALRAIPAMLAAMDQPTIDGLNTYLVSRQTRAAGIKVALSGLGGDELFAGYTNFRTVPRMELFARIWRHVPKAARRPLAGIYSRLAPQTDQTRKLADLARANGQLLHPYFLARMLFTPELRERLERSHDPAVAARANLPLAENLKRTARLDAINRVSYLESRCYMLNTLLRDSDVMSMAHGLELRVPLIDHHLAEKIMALPGAWKLDEQTPKPLLVAALHGELPEQIVHRLKRGFTLPFEHWLRQEMRASVGETLRRSAEQPLGEVLNAKSIWGVWEDFQRGRTSWSRPWALYVLQRWCDLNSVTA